MFAFVHLTALSKLRFIESRLTYRYEKTPSELNRLNIALHRCTSPNYAFQPFDNIHRNSFNTNCSRKKIYYSIINHKTGLGDQLKSLFHYFRLAHDFNLTYIHSPLQEKARHFEPFLRLFHGELDEGELPFYCNLRSNQIQTISPTVYHAKETISLLKTIIKYKNLMQNSSRKFTQFDSYNQTIRLYNPSLRPLILVKFIQKFHFYSPYKVNKTITLAFRKKYCLARLQYPIPNPYLSQLKLFERKNSNHIYIAVHYRAGDLYRSTTDARRWPFELLINVIYSVAKILKEEFSKYSYTFHIFSQAPPDFSQKWSDYFKPVISDKLLEGISIQWHIDLKSEVTLHALITAPVLIRSHSGFGFAAELFRYGLTLTNDIHQLNEFHITINRTENYTFNRSQFKKSLRKYISIYGSDPMEFTSAKQCDTQKEFQCD